MRKVHLFVAAAGAIGATAVVAAGCTDYVAEWYTPLTQPSLLCEGDPTMTPALVTNECGVFARADAAPGGTGTMASPFAKLGDALTLAQSTGKRVYACTSATFTEAVTLSARIEVYGGFDSKTWAYNAATRTRLTAPADVVPLTLSSSASGTEVNDFAITAADAMTAGVSSIAVLDSLVRFDGEVGARSPAPAPKSSSARSKPCPDPAAGGDFYK